MDDPDWLDGLAACFLEPVRITRALRSTTDIDSLFETHASPALRAEDRWYALGSKQVTPGVTLLDVRAGRLRPVSRRPAHVQFARSVLAAQDRMIEAEAHALRFARALQEVRGAKPDPPSVVWRLTSWGSEGGEEPHVPGFSELVAPWVRARTPVRNAVFDWVVRHLEAEAGWNEARRAGDVPDVDLVGPLRALWHTGCGLEALNDDVVLLTLNPRPVRTDRSDAYQRELTASLDRALNAGQIEQARKILRQLPSRAPLTAQLRRRITIRPGLPHERLIPVVRLLLEEGADPYALDAHGEMPFAVASHGPGFDLLIEAGAAVDQRDVWDRTLLHHVCGRPWSLGPIRRVLDAGVDVNARDGLGWTPLHVAAAVGSIELVDLLLARGADRQIASVNGLLPMHLLPDDADALRRRLAVDAGPIAPPGPPPAQHPIMGQVVDGSREAWSILADWLIERGDPRGRSIVGLVELPSIAPTWIFELARLHPLAEILVQRPLLLRIVHGFAHELSLDTRHQHLVDAGLALVRAAPLLHTARFTGRAGEQVLDRLADTGSSHLRRLRIHAEIQPGPLQLGGFDGLLGLELEGPNLADLEITSPTLQRLSVVLPFRRNTVLPPPVKRLDTPRLQELELVLHDTRSLEWLDVVPQLRTLSLRPVSRAMLEELEQRDLGGLVGLKLDSLRPEGLEHVLANPAPWAHLHKLELSVLDLDRHQREDWAARLREVLPRTILRGISYRAPWGPR